MRRVSSLGHRRQTHESRTTHGTRSLEGLLCWCPSPWGCKSSCSSSSSHGRDSGTFPLPPPLGLEGFAFYRAPGWGWWAKVVVATAAAAAGQASPAPSEPDLPAGWQQQDGSLVRAGAPTARRGRPPSHPLHLSPARLQLR